MGPEKVRGRWSCYRHRFWLASGESFPTIKGRRAEKEDTGQERWRFRAERGQFGLARSAELTTKWMGIKRKRMQNGNGCKKGSGLKGNRIIGGPNFGQALHCAWHNGVTPISAGV